MSVLEKKDLLFKAIPVVGLYTNAESSIIKKMINVAIGNVAVIQVKELKRQLDLSHTAVYSSLKTLQLKEVITKLQSQPHSYEINLIKLEHIITLYQNITL